MQLANPLLCILQMMDQVHYVMDAVKKSLYGSSLKFREPLNSRLIVVCPLIKLLMAVVKELN